MSRFKMPISAAVGTMLVAMMLLAACTEEAGAKTRIGAAGQARPRAHHVRVGAGDFNGDRIVRSRRSHVLPYMEQGNTYRLRRP